MAGNVWPFYIVEKVAPFSDNQNAVFFRSFSVDQRYRNKGIGKVVMEKLVPFITSTFQDINEIVLTVNTDNPHAMALSTTRISIYGR